MHDDQQHCGDVQIGQSQALSDGSDRETESLTNLYPTRRGWHLGGRDRGGVRVLTAAGWAESLHTRDVEFGDSLDDVDPRGLVS